MAWWIKAIRNTWLCVTALRVKVSPTGSVTALRGTVILVHMFWKERISLYKWKEIALKGKVSWQLESQESHKVTLHNKSHTRAGGRFYIAFVRGRVFHGVDFQDGDWWDFNTNPGIGGIFELKDFWGDLRGLWIFDLRDWWIFKQESGLITFTL